MPSFIVAGTGFEGRSEVIRAMCKDGQRVDLVRESDNKHDSEAVAVYLVSKTLISVNKRQIGYFPDNANKPKVVRHLDGGGSVSAEVASFFCPKGRDHPRVSVKFEYL